MQTQKKLHNDPKYTSVAIKREDYEEISKLSKKIIRGVTLTIPQTIKFLVKDGLTRSQLTKKDLIFNYENGRDSK
jgi:hypothetical protein|tara:strand:- start:2599 stop:2823 length:225 start_codon:yes stop_codon:yes gene_type:complete